MLLASDGCCRPDDRGGSDGDDDDRRSQAGSTDGTDNRRGPAGRGPAVALAAVWDAPRYYYGRRGYSAKRKLSAAVAAVGTECLVPNVLVDARKQPPR